MLDEDALQYLKRLAEGITLSSSSGPVDQVSAVVLRLVESLDHNPAIVLGRHRDVLAANRLATAINPGFCVGRNIVRTVFLDPVAREVYGNWEEVAAEAVRTLRMATADHQDDPVLAALVDELREQSDDFQRSWARHEVKDKAIGIKHFHRTPVGPIALGYETLTINGSRGQVLSVYSADPGSRDEHALQHLSAIIAAECPARGPGC